MTTQTLQDQYLAEIGKPVPNNKKNDEAWIQSKLDEFRAGNPVDSTPDEDGNPTPEEDVVTNTDGTTPAEEVTETSETEDEEPSKKEVEDQKSPMTNLDSLKKIQNFYGITNEELYNDDVLTKKYNLSKKEIEVVRTYAKRESSPIILNLNYHEMPDYIQVLFNKYGFTGETLRSEDEIRKLILGDKESTEEKEQEIHQLVEYYNQLKRDAMADDLIVPNPQIEANPSSK